jgi:hypothetical protein
MGSLISREYPTSHSKPFLTAGCIFTNNTHILAGYQPNKKIPCISGFGGKRQGNEDFRITAIRETVEELFDMKDISMDLINYINDQIIPTKIIINGTHVNVVLSFNHMMDVISYIKEYGAHSDIYPDGIPTTIPELIFNRYAKESSEIQNICILPLSKILPIDPSFIEDLNMLIK